MCRLKLRGLGSIGSLGDKVWGMKHSKCLLLVLFIGISACTANKETTEEGSIYISREDAFAYEMGMLLEFYYRKYQVGPTSANDLIGYIDGMTEDEQLVYYAAHKFLKRKGNKLVFTTETTIEKDEMLKIMSVYRKRAIPKRGLYRAYVYIPLPDLAR